MVMKGREAILDTKLYQMATFFGFMIFIKTWKLHELSVSDNKSPSLLIASNTALLKSRRDTFGCFPISIRNLLDLSS